MESYQIINENFGTEYKDNESIEWAKININHSLSEDLIEACSEDIPWEYVSSYQTLSEDFIERHKDDVIWSIISQYQTLSEDFIERNKYDVVWGLICDYQKLSEEFIERNYRYVDWGFVGINQKLSEDFILRNLERLDALDIIKYQKVSLDFIEKNFDLNYVRLTYLSEYHQLSEGFIERYKDGIDWIRISKYQKLSDDFIKKYNRKLLKTCINDNWIYKSTDEKKQAVINTGLYECHDDYFIAYKAIRPDRYSLYNFQYKYEKGGIYESWCDCSDDLYSFGLSVGTESSAKIYGCGVRKNLIVRCKVRYEDVGRVVHIGEKIRCFKIEILD